MKRRHLDALLWATAGICMAVIPLAHEDPWVRRMLCEVVGCFRSDQATFWNKLFYDMAIGTLLSLIFYWLLVRLPEAAKNRRLQHRLKRHYQGMKQEIVIQLLFAVEGSASLEIVEKLATDPVAFRNYFYAAERARWYRAMNRFDSPDTAYFDAVKVAISDFTNEVDFTVDHADIGDDELFEDLKNLSLLLQNATSRPKDYNGTKAFFGILQMLVGGWGGGMIGTMDHDRIGQLIDRLYPSSGKIGGSKV